MNHKFPKLMTFLLILTLAVPLFLIPSGAAPTVNAAMGPVRTASDAFASKIHPKLQAAVAAAAPTDDVNLLVYARAGSDLSRYLDNLLVRPYVMPNGTQAFFGRAKMAQVGKLASLPEVAAVQEAKSMADLPIRPDGPARRVNPDRDALRARLAALKAGEAKATVSRPPADKARIASWFDVLDAHKSRAAWELGYTGEGVKVMVNDSGIDFSHPDLQGTIARITDPASPYYGWPEAFDSFSMLALISDWWIGTDYIASGLMGNYAPDYIDTSTTRSGDELTVNPDGTLSAVFAPIDALDPAGYTYKFPATSKSGVYHFGSHPDTVLEKYYFDERPAVLVVDENTPGVYDTVYVDLDDDYDFTNEKKAVKGDEYIYRDLDGDGYADLSGGNIYWISDGVNPVPFSDVLWGAGTASWANCPTGCTGIPGAGDLVAFTVMDWSEPAGDHGQLCASAVAGQGVIDGGAPAWKPAGDGTPGTGLVQGGGKNAKLVAAGNNYLSADTNESYIFAALGYDGIPGTDDDVQIISNSWGFSAVHNDGWDYTSRSIDSIMHYLNPTLSDMNSTGNGAAGYGTVTSPGESLGVSVGASTVYGSDNTFDSIATMDQIQYNDVQSWSNRGPSAQGGVGVSVLADGAWGPGALALSEVLDGWNAWESWGGTSRSAPIAAGNLALVYDAFKARNGRWPTNVEARAILMAGADAAYYDGLTEGAGTINAERAVKVAAGLEGVYVLPDNWAFGNFRGENYDAFANIMHQGESSTKTFTVYNQTDADVTLAISDDSLKRIGSKEFDFTTINRTQETKNFYVPDYLFDFTNLVPAGTDLMEVKAVFPFAEFDPDGNYTANSSWRVVPLDWTDINGDGTLWTDKNGNGAVNCPIVGGVPNYADPTCEIQEGEYNRFGYGYDQGTALQQRVKKPLERMHDGIFVALQHRTNSALVPITHFKIQVNFYQRADFPWLTTPASVTVPAGGQATFDATMTVPALAGVGLYDAAIRVSDGVNTANVPVVVNVAAFSPNFLFGGPPKGTAPYDNGEVYGYFDWSWRAESGDWRFYFVDVPDDTPEGTNFLVDNRWTGAFTDIDTLVMGPTQDCFSNGVGCAWPSDTNPNLPDTGFYGPYTLDLVGGSPLYNISAGKWLWDTSTGGTRDIVAAPAQPGLNLIALHNVMYDGREPQERFQGQVGTIGATPDMIDLYIGNTTSGSFPMSVQSSLPLVDLQVEAFGLGLPETHAGLPQIQDDPNDPSTSSYTFPIAINHGAKLEVSTTADAGDIDLFLLYDFNGDGSFDWNSELIAASTTSTPNEHVSLSMPPDGNYLAAVHGWAAAATTFDITINTIQGNDLTVSGLPAGPFQPNTPINFTVNWSKALAAGEEAQGLILAGMSGAPGVLEIPVRLHNIITGSVTARFNATDALLDRGYPTTNFGSYGYLYTGAADNLRSVLKFDLSSIPTTYPVTSARLYLRYEAFSGGNTSHELRAYEVTTPWADNTVTWRAPWTAAGGDYAAVPEATTSISGAEAGTWKELDVTSLVAQWVANPASNNGLLIKTVGSVYTKYRFSSSENWNTAWHPYLEVTYGTP